MATFLVAPAVLPRLAEELPQPPVPPLTVKDCRDNYSTSEGDGLWIRPFLDFVEKEVARRCHRRLFQFSTDECLDEEVLAEIPQGHVRALIVEFINAHYDDWRDRDVSLPNYDDVRSDCRSWCDECDSGWTEQHAEYDGLTADDVEPDEDENAPGLSRKEREMRQRRNQERQRERDRLRQAQEDAESEITDRELTCDSDCDSFMDHVDDCYRDQVEIDTEALRTRFEEFLKERGDDKFPPLHPAHT